MKVHSQQQSLVAQQSAGSSPLYKDELSLVPSSRMIVDGPVTAEGLLQSCHWQVLHSFLCNLVDVRRNADDRLTQSEIKALVSLCSCKCKV